MFSHAIRGRCVLLAAIFDCYKPERVLMPVRQIDLSCFCCNLQVWSFRRCQQANLARPAMSQPLRARLGVARLILEEQRGTSSHQVTSRLQKDAVLELLRSPNTVPDASTRAEISQIIIGMPWNGSDGDELLAALVPSQPLQVGRPRRRSQQEYHSIVYYGTEEMWQVLQSDASSDHKRQIVFRLAAALGLRCPSEHTLKFMNSFWLFMSESSEGLSRITVEQKHAFLGRTRTEFDRFRIRLADPPDYLSKLPEEPLHLLRDHPLLYKNMYRQGTEPSRPPVDIQRIHELDSTYRCRGGAVRDQPTGGARVHAAPVVDITPSSGGSMAGMERLANLFMDRLGTLQDSQQRLLELVVTGSGTGSRQNVDLSALADMQPGRRNPIRRTPTLTFDGLGSAGQRGAAQGGAGGVAPLQLQLAAAAPSQATMQRAVSVASLGDVGGAQVVQAAEPQVEAIHQEPDASAAHETEWDGDAQVHQPEVPNRTKLDAMLDMLHQRDGERRRSKRKPLPIAEVPDEAAATVGTPAKKVNREQPAPIAEGTDAAASTAGTPLKMVKREQQFDADRESKANGKSTGKGVPKVPKAKGKSTGKGAPNVPKAKGKAKVDKAKGKGKDTGKGKGKADGSDANGTDASDQAKGKGTGKAVGSKASSIRISCAIATCIVIIIIIISLIMSTAATMSIAITITNISATIIIVDETIFPTTGEGGALRPE